MQLSDIIGVFFQEKVENRVFVKLDSRYDGYFPEDQKYFGRDLWQFKSMYGMTNSGKLFTDELTEWLLESDFIQYQCRMYIYYKYAPDGQKWLFYLMLMTASKYILLKLLENGFWMI